MSGSCIRWWRRFWQVCFRSKSEKHNKVNNHRKKYNFYSPQNKHLTCCGSCGSWQGVLQLEQPSGRAPLPARCHRPRGPADGRCRLAGWNWYLGHRASKDTDEVLHQQDIRKLGYHSDIIMSLCISGCILRLHNILLQHQYRNVPICNMSHCRIQNVK